MKDIIVCYVTPVVAVLGFLFSLYQYYINAHRGQKESTLIAYRKLQDITVPTVRELRGKIPRIVSKITECKKTKDCRKCGECERCEEYKDWNKLTTSLADLENFCVGINLKIYDINVLNRLGGGHFIQLFSSLEPIITEKRKDKSSKHYDEFEMTVNELKRRRKKLDKNVIQG